MDEEVALRIETQRPQMPVHVNPSGESVELGIGEPSGGTWLVTALSLPQRAHLAQVISDTEVHRR